MPFYFLSISLLASSVIAYEITLVRLFSIAQWHHFASMIISLALLGFGTSGTVISLVQRWLMPRFHVAYTCSGIVYSISVVGCFTLSQSVPFNPFMLVWQPSQMWLLLATYLILSIPFFFGAACIGLALLQFTANVHRLYFFDLLGSGLGALGIICAMYVLPPAQNLTLISAAGFSSILIANIGERHAGNWRLTAGIGVTGSAFVIWMLLNPVSVKISPYKALSSTLSFPDAEILSQRHSPLGSLHVVRSASIHAAPGMSLRSQHSIPAQLGLFTDADAMTAITHFSGDLSTLAYLGDTTSALAYHLLEKPRVLVLGAGGGGQVLNALYHSAAAVDAVELNPQVIDLVAREHGDFAGQIYAPDSTYPVRVHTVEPRGFIRSSAEKYDLIQVSLSDFAGTSALRESYLYTVEAILELFGHLRPDGVVSISYGGLKTPPRGMVKLFATAVEALERIDGSTPAEQLALIRGFDTGTLLMKNGKFHADGVRAIRDFCNARSFDIAYYPQMPESEANRYNQLSEPIYFRAAQAILSADRAQFFQGYPFDVRPATDNRPYFFQFLRFHSLIEMIRTIGRNAIPFVEWGYLLLIATLVQAMGAALILILLPLFFLRRQSPSRSHHESRFAYWRVFGYFLSLGIGFMFIEMAFIQKFQLLLAHPTYAVAVVLCAFLVFAGLGSLSCRRLKATMETADSGWLRGRNPITAAVVMLSLLALLYLYLLPSLFHPFLASPDALKVFVSIALIAPLAFFMGMPFPFGIELLRHRHPNLIAWAWGINGYASVVSAILATCLAIAFGFNTVIVLAIAIYLAGAWVVPR